jgi:uncharacterized protein YndB with AHSA1/START domain
MNPTSASETIVREINIKAPAQQVFDALTDPDQRAKWWTAGGRFQAEHMDSDLRPGGKWTMRGTGVGGKPFRVSGAYQTVEPPRLLVFTWLPDWQKDATETVVRIDLEEKDGITTVRLTHSGLTSEGSRVSHRGWPEILASLQAYVQEMV